MTNLQMLSKDRIDQLLALLDAEKINATTAIYQELSDLGYGYAGWGYGVATGETITGQGALLFMQSVAEKTPELMHYMDQISGVVNYVNQTFSFFTEVEKLRPKKFL